jgi:hypothetical protein
MTAATIIRPAIRALTWITAWSRIPAGETLEDKADGEGERPLYSVLVLALGLLMAWGQDQGFAAMENKEAEWSAPQKN